MANIYDKASLVMIPSGTKASKIFSQKPVNGDGDFTFSRSTAATRVNADGNIEKETQNLALQSNSFNTSPWSLQDSASLTSGQSGYDGTNNAWLLSKAANYSRVEQNIVTSGVWTFSCYAKAGTLDWISFENSGIESDTSFFDLSNGVLGSLGSGCIDSAIEDIGSGWYRCSVTISGTSGLMRIQPSISNGVVVGGTGNLYIQDAQLEQGLVARDVIETTTAAVEGGITDNVPRLDYTDSSCPALLLEPQRRNLVRHSEYIGGLEVGHTPTISIESVTNPEGYSFAYKVVAVSTSSRVQDNIGTQGNNMVFSGFFKGTGTATRLRFRNNQGAQVQYNIDSSGDFSLQFEDAANDNYGIEDYGNGWHRIYFETTTASGGTDNYIQVYPDSENGTGSVYVWGLQVEDNGAGGGSSYATSYIPTYGTSVTRDADLSLVTGVADVIGQSEGTAYVDFMFNNKGDAGVDSSFFAMKNSAGTSYLNIFRLNTTLAFRFFDNGSNQFFHTETPANQTRLKIAFAYKQNDFALYINGVQEAVDTNGSVGAMSQIHLAGFSVGDNITENYQTMLFKTRLSNEELAALTTI
jgi:hypothetical protein